MSGTAALAADERLAAYDFGASHPLHPRRLGLGLSLLRACGVLGPADLLPFEPAKDTDVRLVHDPGYLDALERFSAWPDELEPAEAARWGFVGDNEPFAGMAEAALEIAGATVAAVEAVAEGRVAHAFAPMGGLHHALRSQASGFCLVNDLAVAIARCTRARPWRVMYVDLDVHHGDGVQQAFFDDPMVLTVSLHETGRHLWPGSGDIHELGAPPGVGRSVNLPLEPYTGDDGFLEAFEALVPPLAAAFRPDLLVTQNGCDGHVTDPLADLRLTVGAFRALARRLHELAHEHCGGRWVATGGGGYAVDRVVPRAWAVLWAEMSGRRLPAAVPPDWLAANGPGAAPLPEAWDDPPVEPVAVAAEIAQLNRRTIDAARRLVLPLPSRTGWPTGRPDPPATAAAELPAWAPRRAVLDIPKGRLALLDRCPASRVQQLEIEGGLGAPGRARAGLAELAARPGADVVLAHTGTGVVVAYLAVVEPEPGSRFAGLADVFEIGALEVAPGWRRLGLGRRLLEFALTPEPFEQLVLYATGLPWQWDLDGGGLASGEFRDVLTRLHAGTGFVEAPASPAELAGDPASVLLVRFGSRIGPGSRQAFEGRLRRPG